MKDKFYIINLIKNLISDFDKYLVCFPNRGVELKREIFNILYDNDRISLNSYISFYINYKNNR